MTEFSLERRKNKRVRRLVEFDANELEWLDKSYPRGSTSWIMTELLKAFHQAHLKDPLDLMKISAEGVRRSIEKDKEENEP